MNKLEIKNILISMRTQDNEPDVNFLLGKLSMLSEKEIFEYIQKVGDSEEAIRNFLTQELLDLKVSHARQEPKYQINKLFTYGISGNCIHLHLPGDLHELINKQGFKKTMDIVNLYLLDAINRIKSMKENQFPTLQNVDSIYMISPILLSRELKFLEEIDFKISLYHKKDLSDKKFISEHPEAQLAAHIFGTDRNVGTAQIDLDIVSTQEWQNKMKCKTKEFNDNGIFIQENENIK